jgi:hypothetical protein
MIIYFTPVLQATNGYFIGHDYNGVTHSVSANELVNHMAHDVRLGELLTGNARRRDFDMVAVYVDI